MEVKMKQEGYVDPRVIRTKKMIREALKKLMEENGTGRITISDITERAGLARPTFYLHYESVEDVLEEIVQEIITPAYKNFIDERGKVKGEDIQIEALVKILRIYQENAKFFEALVNNGFTKVITDSVQDGTRAYLQNLKEGFPQELNPFLFNILTQFKSGAFSFMLIQWIANGMHESAELLAAINVRLGNYIDYQVFEENILADISFQNE